MVFPLNEMVKIRREASLGLMLVKLKLSEDMPILWALLDVKEENAG